MDNVIEIGLWALGLFVFVQSLGLIIGVSRYIKMPLCESPIEPIARADMPDVAPVLDTAAPVLLEQGFRYLFSLRHGPLLAVEGMPPSYSDVYFNDALAVHAQVFPSDLPTPANLCNIYLIDRCDDGSTANTVNGYRHALMPYPKDMTVADAYAPDFAGQLAHHLATRAQGGKAHVTTPGAADDAPAFGAPRFAQLESEGKVYRRDDSTFGLRLRTAIALVWRLRRAAAWMKKSAALPPVDFGPARALAERAVFVRTLCVLRGLSAPVWFRRSTFALSAALFLALGAWWWGLAGAFAIAAVVLVHEAGHWAAMKAAGFRDVHVFFVPGMGGATSGEKHEASPYTHLLVYLAGPMPGIVLSLAALAWIASGGAPGDAAWYPLLAATIFFSLAINLFNLLPVLPLDGGRIVELFVVGRLPWLRFVFSLASALAFAAGAYFGEDMALYAIAALMLFASSYHYNTARAASLWLRQKHAADAAGSPVNQAGARLHDFLAQPAFAAWPFQTRLTIAMALLPRVQGRLPRWKESAAGLGLYAACALVPVAVGAFLLLRAPDPIRDAFDHASAAMSRAVPLDQEGLVFKSNGEYDHGDESMTAAARAASVAAANGDEDLLDALRTAQIEALVYGTPEEAVAYARRFHALAAKLDANGSRHAHGAVVLADAIDNSGSLSRAERAEVVRLRDEAEAYLLALLQARPLAADANLLVGIWERKSRDATVADALALRRRIVALLENHLDKDDEHLAIARRTLAQALDRDGQPEQAEAVMRTLLAGLAQAAEPAAYGLQFRVDAGWMFSTHGKNDAAAAVVAHDLAIEHGSAESSLPDDEPRALMWMVERQRGNWQAARGYAVAMSVMRQEEAGNWIMCMLPRSDPELNYAAGLMLADAERTLGNMAATGKLVARLRDMHDKRTGTQLTCRMRVDNTSWRRPFEQLLFDIEQRELQCQPAPPSLRCPPGDKMDSEDEQEDPDEEEGAAGRAPAPVVKRT